MDFNLCQFLGLLSLVVWVPEEAGAHDVTAALCHQVGQQINSVCELEMAAASF